MASRAIGALLARAGLALLVLVAAGCSRQPAAGHDRAPSQTPTPGPGFAPPAPGTYELPPIQRAADGDVLDAEGAPRRLFDYLRGKLVLLSFVYTRCSDARGCPMATAVFHVLHRQIAEDPSLATRVRLVTLSFDPEHDAPAVMARYARLGGVDPGGKLDTWAFLTTSSARDLGPILEGYGQYIVPERDEAGRFTGTFRHVLKVYLIDRRLRVRNIYSAGFLEPELAINDVKTLLLEEQAPG